MQRLGLVLEFVGRVDDWDVETALLASLGMLSYGQHHLPFSDTICHTLMLGNSGVSDLGRPDTTSFARYTDVAKLLAVADGALLSLAAASADRHGRTTDCLRAMARIGIVNGLSPLLEAQW